MKFIEDRTTLVLAGNFNPAILTPQWIAKHCMGYQEQQEFQVEMLAPVGGGIPARYLFDDFSYAAAFSNVTLHLNSADVALAERSTEIAACILEKLPHTPIAGVGFNFGFSVAEPTDTLLQLLTTCDPMTDAFPGNPEVVKRQWGNTIQWDDALVNINCGLAGGEVTISFNFHHSTSSAPEATAILRSENAYKKHRDAAIAAAKALTHEDLED